MKETFSQSIIVTQSPAEVFEFLSVPRNHPTFVPNLLALETEPPKQAWEVGVRAVGQRKVMGRTVVETATMVERIPNERIIWDGEAMNFSVRGTWAMEPVENGTKVTISTDMERTMMMRILSAFGGGNVEKAQMEILAALKIRLGQIA